MVGWCDGCKHIFEVMSSSDELLLAFWTNLQIFLFLDITGLLCILVSWSHLSVHSGFTVTTGEVSIGTVEDVDILLESFQANLNK